MKIEKLLKVEKNLHDFYLSFSDHENVVLEEKEYISSIEHESYNWPDLILSHSQKSDGVLEAVISKQMISGRTKFWLTNSLFIEKNKEIIQKQNFIPINIWESMYFRKKEIPVSISSSNITFSIVDSMDRLDDWMDIVEEVSFYPFKMDRSLFLHVFKDSNFLFIIGKSEGQMVSTALLFSNGFTTGLYYVSTKKEFRRLGFGKGITLFAMEQAIFHFKNDIVLQASKMAKKLYLDIGFEQNGQLVIFAVS